jgi:hypothetical protein
MANGNVYLLGGYNGSNSSTVHIGRLSSGGTLTFSATGATDLPAVNRGASAVSHGNKIFIIGGHSGSHTDTVRSSPISADGSNGAWVADDSLPAARSYHSSVTANGHAYVIGGFDGGTWQDTVYYSKFDSSGNLGAWSTTSVLPDGLSNASAVVNNGYIYVIGGRTASSTYSSAVYYAKVNSDGTLGSWQTGSNPLSTGTAYHASTVKNGHIYNIGGVTSGGSLNTASYSSTQRVQIAGSLDLVGAYEGTLASAGDGNIGGTLTAGNTTIVGTLDVYGNANLGQNASVGENLDVGGNLHVSDAVTLDNGLGDKISLYGADRLGETNMYGFGVESNYLYSKASGGYRWYSNANADEGASDIMQLASNGNLTVTSTTNPLSLNRTGSDGYILGVYQDTNLEGGISVSGTTVSYNAFTGSHYARTEGSIEQGALVSMTGENSRLGSRENSEIIYGVEKTTQANDPAVLGSYLSVLEPKKANGTDNPESNDNPSLIMSTGNGEMWAVDNGSSLNPGDNLISSDTAGHAMKDPGTYAISHVVAKVAEPVNWDSVTETVGGKKVKKISVLFSFYDKMSIQEPTAEMGELNLTSATIDQLNASEAIITNLSVTSTATIGTLQVTDNATFSGNITIEGHFIAKGEDPTLEVLQNAGANSEATIDGNDTAGTITIQTGTNPLDGELLKVLFNKQYGNPPRVILSPANGHGADLKIFRAGTTNEYFILKSTNEPAANTTYKYDYFIIQSE